MREFFHGWRRKAGCITLVMACLGVGAWIRSLAFKDAIVREGQSVTYFSSGHGLIQWDQITLASGEPIRQKMKLRWETHCFSTYVQGYEPVLSPIGDCTFLWQCFGFQIAVKEYETLFGARARRGQWAIPYWSLVFSFTILSAYLILWKPRKRTGADHG